MGSMLLIILVSWQ